MKKRQPLSRDVRIEHLKTTYLERKYVSGRDLAIIQKTSDFPNNLKKDRSYTAGVNHAKKDFELLRFFFTHLKPMYRLRILNSNEFDSFIEKILYAQGSFHLQTREEQARSLKIALQMMEYARLVIKENMPEEFQTVLDNSSEQWRNMIKAISAYQKREKIKDSPDIQSKFIDSNLSAFTN